MLYQWLTFLLLLFPQVGTLGGRPQSLHDPRRRRLWLPSETRHAGASLFLIALMIVAHLVARPFDELSKAHRVLQWLELGSLCVCWLTLHAGTVFFIGEKEGRISYESHGPQLLRGGRQPSVHALLDGRVRRAALVRAERAVSDLPENLSSLQPSKPVACL